MLLNNFDPSVHCIDTIVFGSGNWDNSPTEKEIVSSNLPFLSIINPIKSICVQGLYSLDGKEWFYAFPKQEAIEKWISDDIVIGMIRFKIAVPAENLVIREIGFYGKGVLYAYKIINNFVIGKTPDDREYVFNYNLKCNFVSSLNVNFLI